MTKLDLEVIKADRAAGTDGPLSVFSDKPSNTVAVGSGSGEFVAWAGFDFREGCKGFYSAFADARRIARVPDMEAALIAQEAALKAADELANAIHELQEALSEAREGQIVDWGDSALTAYRTARKDTLWS